MQRKPSITPEKFASVESPQKLLKEIRAYYSPKAVQNRLINNCIRLYSTSPEGQALLAK